ncbi:spore morphogenesis/germination protein YwcE [Fictibacillus iocasae]|uniref:Spore morphogenesis/germination protein YwcE n=1 Tax=Fictibacillus iocasae TaxID=2715437 RepID=A0ABW2NUK0_9BACL
MDVFVLYLFIATATPLFLWTESKKMAIMQMPFIAVIWLYAILHMTNADLSPMMHTMFISIFVANVIFAHIAAVLIFAGPYFKKKKLEKDSIID